MDTIGDFITRIRNAGIAQHNKLDVPSSNIRQGVARILKDYGYIKTFRVAQDGKQGLMRVYLNYNNQGQSTIKNIQRVSRPRKRIYVKKDKIPKVRSGYGVAILSTNKGILSHEEAIDQNVGGELLVQVW